MKPDMQPKPETVLIVDDDVRVVELLQITLGGRGYQVITAYDGEAALQAVRNQRPDLLVLDVRLPRRSGFDVLDSIRRDPLGRHLPVILISADAATESRLQGLKLGADDYLAKPFSPRELIIKIRRILDRSMDRNLLLLKTEVLEDEIRRSRDTLLQMRQELGQNLSRMGTVLSQVIELNRHHSIDEILERFVIATVANLDFERVVLLTASSDGTLRSRVWRGVDEGVARALSLAAEGPVSRICASMGRPLRMDELESHPDTAEEVLRLSSAGIVLVAPAISEGRLQGLLGLGERNSSLPPGHFDYKLLEILGDSIVAALQNVHSFARTQRSFLETIASLIRNIEGRYPFVQGHSERVKDLSLAMAAALGLKEDQVEDLRFGALLHDLGQLDQYGELLESVGVLSATDRRLLRQRAAEQVSHLLGPGGEGAAGEIVRHHQEYWNGSGCPDGLRGAEIPLGARIVALANAWDALIHDRPHRKAYRPEQALCILRERAGQQFDPDLLPMLERAVNQSLVGAT